MSGLGRIHIPDARDKRFPMRAPRTQRTWRYWTVPGEVNDQGNTSHCVGHSCEAWLRAYPIVNAYPDRLDPADIYHAAQKVDQWPGEAYEGTSVRAGMDTLRSWGFVERYTWAWDVGTIAAHLLEVGPVVVGTTWTYGMFTPDRWGYIHPDGGSAGGHAYLLVGCNRKRKNPDGTRGAFRLQNSWGNWGDPRPNSAPGRAWISFADMQTLMDDYGEACAAVEIKR